MNALARAFTAASTRRPSLESVRPPREVPTIASMEASEEGEREREMLEKQLEEVSDEASRLQVRHSLHPLSTRLLGS